MTTILVVDDNAAMRNVIARALQYHGFHVYEAIDGYDALAQLEHVRPGLVITDVAMPRINGTQLAHVMARHPDLAKIPVLLMSGEDSMAPSGYPVIEKPIPVADLIAVVRSLIQDAA